MIKVKTKVYQCEYPVLRPFQSRYDERGYNDGILYNINGYNHSRGIFLYYDSGLFVNYQNLIEDMRDETNTTLFLY